MDTMNLLKSMMGIEPYEPSQADLLKGFVRMVMRKLPNTSRQVGNRNKIALIVYMAYHEYVKRHGEAPFEGYFRSTMMGPSNKNIVEAVRLECYDRLHEYHETLLTQDMVSVIEDVTKVADGMTGGQVVAQTQSNGTAWAAKYGANSRNNPRIMTIKDILNDKKFTRIPGVC